jgi:hypothetical protein
MPRKVGRLKPSMKSSISASIPSSRMALAAGVHHHGPLEVGDGVSRRRAVAEAQPQCRADGRSWERSEVCNQGHWGAWRRPLPLDCYPVGETDPIASGRTGGLREARAEGALLAYVEGGDWPSDGRIGDSG